MWCLILTAAWLAFESKSLLIGESASPEVRQAIHDVLDADARIERVSEVATLHMGPDFIVAIISADFVDDLNTEGVQSAVTELNSQVKALDGRIKRVFIEAERGAHHSVTAHA